MSDDDPCPSCGIPYDLLPVGHDLITPLDGSPQTCEVLRGVSPLTYARDFPSEPTGPCFGTMREPTGWNVYAGSAFLYFIPSKPRLDLGEHRRRQLARVKRKRR